VKGTIGLGFPLIATPTVALLLNIRTAVTILILPNLFMDSAQVIRDGFPYAIFRRFNWYTMKLSVLVLLFSRAGFYAGLKTQDRVDQIVFNRGLLVLLAVIGLLLIVRAATQGR